MKKVLTIAGSDCSGGAGIQADIKTMTMHGVYGMSAITALTAQNTMGVQGISVVPKNFLAMQLDSVFTDIMPDAVKIGMVSDVELIEVIVEKLLFYKAKNIVVDPVMVATSGSKLIRDDAINTMKSKLFKIATIVTPNIPEAEILANIKILDENDMELAGKIIHEEYKCAVLCKGGHSINDANDLLFEEGHYKWFKSEKIENPNTHGTGCTLSSSIASNIAKGQNLDEAVLNAKKYVSRAIGANLNLGEGSGPLNHMV